MKKYIIIVAFLIISILLQHVVHELMHAFVGKKQGLKLIKIQWFTYHGGTKVFFEQEEKVLAKEMPITAQWIYMNIAGIVTTTFLAYCLSVAYYFVPMNYGKLFVWILSIILLLTDSSYAMICAFGNCGDLYMVNQYLGKKKYVTKIISVIVFIINCAVTYLLIKC